MSPSTAFADPATPVPPAVALSTLTHAVQALSMAQSAEDVQEVVRSAARRLTGADGATFVLRDGDKCFYVDESAIAPLWKGKRFPLEECISGWSMLNRRHVVIEDIYADERIPHDAYRSTFVRSLLMVPIRTMNPLGSIGIYWAHHHRATEQQVGLARALADSTAVALEHVGTLRELDETRQLSETDPLTGLPNRRAWDEALLTALQPGADPLCVAIVDLDRFKRYNDRHGHQAGDRLLCAAAASWREALRPGDLLARYGGEEFALLLPGCTAEAAGAVADRLRRVMPDGETSSVGLACWDGQESADSLVGRADAALYRAKRAGRDRAVSAD